VFALFLCPAYQVIIWSLAGFRLFEVSTRCDSDSGEACGSDRMSNGVLKGSGRTARGANPGEIGGYAASTLKGLDSGCSTLTGLFVRAPMIPGFHPGCSV